MLATKARLEETARGTALAVDVSSDKGGVHSFPLRIEYVGVPPDRLTVNGDAFVPALLWPAMRLGEPLIIEAGISPAVYENLEAIQILSAAWIPGLRRIPVETHPRHAIPAAAGNGLFFSCGVDSFYSLLKHRSSLTHLICVQGYDMTLDEDQPFARLFSSTREVARELGMIPVEVRTNLRTITDRFFRWSDIFVSGLATVALSTQGMLGKCTFASDCHFNRFIHRGTHPALDHLWSTDNLTFIHDGFELNRIEKVARMGKVELAMRHLRVCLEDPAAYNCGRCEKCLRTMLELHAVGALEGCSVFPTRLRPEDIARVRIKTPIQVEYFTELREVLAKSDADRPYVKAVTQALRAHAMRNRYYRYQSALESVPGSGLLAAAMERAKVLYRRSVKE